MYRVTADESPDVAASVGGSPRSVWLEGEGTARGMIERGGLEARLEGEASKVRLKGANAAFYRNRDLRNFAKTRTGRVVG